MSLRLTVVRNQLKIDLSKERYISLFCPKINYIESREKKVKEHSSVLTVNIPNSDFLAKLDDTLTSTN